MLILASQSPRRKEILSYFSLEFEQIASPFNEMSVPFLGDPKEYALSLARGKAIALVSRYPEQPILGADSVVYRKGKIYEKPTTAEEAFEMLSALAGKSHTVYTALALCRGPQIWSDVAATEVTLRPLTPEQIRLYQKAINPYDKAGSYMVQEAGSLIVEKISGSFYNAMGLPIQTLAQLLLNAGIDLWDHLIK